MTAELGSIIEKKVRHLTNNIQFILDSLSSTVWRQAVRYIRQSPSRWKKFQECCEEENLVKKSLCLDIPTRWNSTYLMLNRAIEYESTLLDYADHDIGLSHHLEFVDIIDGSPADVLLGSMAKRMKEKFDKYWGDPEKMNKMIFISCVLDSRYKFDYVNFALAKISSLLASIITVQTEGAFGSFFEELKRHKAGIGGVDFKSELKKYLTDEVENEIADSNILLWWKVNSPRFPILAEMARDVLAIPISSVASECAFCTGGRILDSFRSSLTPKLVEVLMCLQDWLQSEPLPVSVEEDLDVLEQLEQGVIMPRLRGHKTTSHVWGYYERIEEGDDGW
ncbi:zinc finger BED domain-containing protein RICESLEEPER 2-like [Nicotiana tomentosiformis]|uniref:zinc finger BED domain-containing protein RICESLEEPER 2-like n=1 Tax=Nicotiana tomentosiformis TaxID=4098 RepID=UPI00388C3D33